ncbi:MAG: hypothetical protein HFI33_08585 [Lachnospiraceae bacterium]|nr:hypothetical protein [Lachnospiraceae bacterium]
MEFREFILAMTHGVQKELPGDVEVRPQTVCKNNGVMLQGLLFQKESQKSAPTIYLEAYYQAYLEGADLCDLISQVAGCYKKYVWEEAPQVEHFLQYETVKKTVVYKLVNYRQNERLLREVPHLPYLDLALVFYSLFVYKPMGRASILIRNSHLDMWGVTHRRLYGDARENTPRLLKPQLSSLWEALHGEAPGPGKAESGAGPTPFYVLTNREHINGAASLLYPDMLERCAALCRGEFFVLPSSVHEVLLLPYSRRIEMGKLKAMVREINQKQVSPQETLSDLVYFYSLEGKRLLAL